MLKKIQGNLVVMADRLVKQRLALREKDKKLVSCKRGIKTIYKVPKSITKCQMELEKAQNSLYDERNGWED